MSTQTFCHEPLDGYGDHAATCQYGLLRIKRHDEYADLLADIIAETGAHVRREAFIRQFTNPSHEAWLDIWAFGAVHVQDLIVDVSIRHPAASHYQPAASREIAVAAIAGENEKEQRYPAQGGRAVVPFVTETWGRLGPSADSLLQNLAAEAARRARQRGQSVTTGTFLRRWRASLDACLQRNIALEMAAARSGLPGRAR